MKDQKGFTIVELLIVIVIIGILAALVIVAYNGIQNRAKAAAEQSLANVVTKKVEAFNSIESAYPTFSQLTSNSGNGTANNSKEAKLDDTTVVVDYTASNTTTAATYVSGTKNIVIYRNLSTAGSCVFWWDYSLSTPARTVIPLGNATNATCIA